MRKLETLEFAVREMRAAEEVELANLELADGSVSGLQGEAKSGALARCLGGEGGLRQSRLSWLTLALRMLTGGSEVSVWHR